MRKNRDLQIGDKIYKVNRHNKNIYEIYDIINVDEKTAQANTGFMLKRQIKNNICFATDRSHYKYNSCMDYLIETQELKDKFEKQALVERLSKLDFNQFHLETLRQLELLIKNN
jgi:hypothetical protein